MPVKISGAVGILSNAQLSKMDSTVAASSGEEVQLDQIINRIKKLENQNEGLLPSSVTRKQKKQREKGLSEGRAEQAAQKTKDTKIKAQFNEQKPSVTENFLLALGISNRKKILTSSSLISGTGAPLQKLSEFKRLQTEVTRLKKAQTAIAKTVAGSIPLIGGAAGLTNIRGITSGVFGLITKIGFPAIIITTLATKIYALYKAQFGNGGTRDVRKLIKAEDISLIGEENENIILSGEVLFISNPNVLQGLPRGKSNTQDLRNDQSRYRQRHEGSYL